MKTFMMNVPPIKRNVVLVAFLLALTKPIDGEHKMPLAVFDYPNC